MPRCGLLIVAAALALSGCGVSTEQLPHDHATVLLPRPVTAVDSGFYTALAHGFPAGEGLTISLRPSRGAQRAAHRLTFEQADFAVMDAGELAAARARGDDLVAVLALTQSARSDGDIPLLVATRRTVDENKPLVDSTVRTLVRGYQQVLLDPDSAVADLQQHVPAADRAGLTDRLAAVDSDFVDAAGRVGSLPVAALTAAGLQRKALAPGPALAANQALSSPGGG